MISRNTVIKSRSSNPTHIKNFLKCFEEGKIDNCYAMLDYTPWESVRYNLVKALISEFPKLNDRQKHQAMSLFLRGVYGRFLGGREVVDSEEKTEFEEKNGYYKYIPANHKVFTNTILELRKKFPLNSFIDVGSGMGDKVFLANLTGFEKSFGVEYNKHTYELSTFFKEKFVPRPNRSWGEDSIQFINDDAFNLSFYDYDLIYLYVPIAGPRMRHLWAKILDEMHVGAVLFEYTGTGGPMNILRKAELFDFFKVVKIKYEEDWYPREALVKIDGHHKAITYDKKE